jgi:serine/threonine protein kinase/Tfp pilus assembly protein PilF
MTAEKDQAHPSTEVLPRKAEVEPSPTVRRDTGDSIEDPLEPESPTRQRVADSAQPHAEAGDERLVIGQLLGGRYRIERELGEGGMGVVYLATDQQIAGETFAIKVLKSGLPPEAVTLLRQEVQRTRRLSHPNIVDVHSVSLDGTRLYVLMEYLEGKPLSALLDEEYGRGMPWSRAWPIIEDVGAALAHAHNHSLVHSDLKPANIFVTTAGKTKLLDFGIARATRGPIAQGRSEPLALTPLYASCEMLQGQGADRRDDIYSLACVVYEMLCGERPFGKLTAFEARAARARVRPLEVLSRGQNAALARALAFDREARTASVEKLLAGIGVDKRRAGRGLAVAGIVVAGVVLAGLAYVLFARRPITEPALSARPQAPTAGEGTAVTATVFAPPPHSIAVLPFANLSGDKDQEYFSDGMTEELLDSLSHINELQVVGRTSSFYFKGKDADLGMIARKLNVGAVLEGSVRRSDRAVRITAQLISTVTGFSLWSHTYDLNPGDDILTLQTQIASAVASALKVAMLADVAARVELGGTRDAHAFDAFLRGMKSSNMQNGEKDLRDAIAAYTEAIRFDPHYALAFAARSLTLRFYTSMFVPETALREGVEKVAADARTAITLAPNLGEAHRALAGFLADFAHDFAQANVEYERALALAPGKAGTLREYGMYGVWMGRTEAGLAAARRAVELDPLNRNSRYGLAWALYYARRYAEAVRAFRDSAALDPDYDPFAGLGFTGYAQRDYESAREVCEAQPDKPGSAMCLALTYRKLGRSADAEAMLANLQGRRGEASAYEYAVIYAQWGDTDRALHWLETAVRLRDASLEYVKVDPLLEPLRKEPRFKAIERELKFPE